MKQWTKGMYSIASNGYPFDPLDLTDECLSIDVIATSLSKICRFNGHCRGHYSVAQHSIHVSHLVPPLFALSGLLHDAPEAFLGDIARPLKRTPEFSAYRIAEDRAWKRIASYYGVPLVLHESVKKADNMALMTEIRDLMPRSELYGVYGEPDTKKLQGLDYQAAEAAFLFRFKELTSA